MNGTYELTREEIMQRSAVAAIASAALAAVLLAGCADEPEAPCDRQDVVWDVEAGVYRCPDGAQADVSGDGVDIDIKKPKAPKRAAPKAPAPRTGKK